jgi:deoxycytidine triphosphate deaminase
MLTYERVAELLQQEELRVNYYWDPTADPPTRLNQPEVAIEDNANPATVAFRAAFFGDRLGLTLGPLILSHRYRTLRGRSNYRDVAGVFDLRETDNRAVLRKGESITINTIEDVALGGSLAAVTLPRLTHATAGLVLSPSYIDPHWAGILVLHLVNLSGKELELRFGERIAITRLYQVVGPPLDETFRRRFAQKSHHYGLGWARVEGGGDPFPLRKGPPPARMQLTLPGLTRRMAAMLGATGITALGVAAALIEYGRLSGKVDRIEPLERRVQSLETEDATLRERVRELPDLRARLREFERELASVRRAR